MSKAASVLDAIRPPHGYRATAGIWTTHDLSVQVINEVLLPALAGLGSSEANSIFSAPGDFQPGALLVCAAADCMTTTGLLPEAVRVLPVSGRRQHAKAAVLHYEQGHKGMPGPRSLTRTLITSANLTRGGLTRNRELVVVETVGSDSTGPSLLPSVLDAIPGLRLDVPSPLRHHLTSKVRELRRLANGAVVRSDAVRHSLKESLVGSFADWFTDGPADRLLLVGPAFASDTSDVADLLSSVLGPTTSVELVVGADASRRELTRGQGRVEVPTGLLSGLRRAAKTVNVHAVPASDDDGSPRRTLHGKTIMVQYGNQVWQMAGSANLTRRGLGGLNRELVVFIECGGPEAVDAELHGLGVISVPESRIVPGRDASDLPLRVDPSKAPVMAVFVPNPGQNAASGRLVGTITVTAGGGTPRLTWIEVDGQRFKLVNGRAAVTLGSASTVAGLRNAASFQILVSLTPKEGSTFWSAIPGDVRRRSKDQMLARLLADVDRATRGGATPSRKTAGGGASPSGGTDGFSLPGNVRLNVVTRYRQLLARFDLEREDDVLNSLFPDGVELMVARTVIAAARGDGQRNDSHVLGALHAAVLDAREDDQP